MCVYVCVCVCGAEEGNRYNGTNFSLPHRDYTFSDSYDKDGNLAAITIWVPVSDVLSSLLLPRRTRRALCCCVLLSCRLVSSAGSGLEGVGGQVSDENGCMFVVAKEFDGNYQVTTPHGQSALHLRFQTSPASFDAVGLL